jgi:hydroxypyruvate isomerase
VFRLGITAPGNWFDCSTVEAVERAAAVGVDGIEFFDWEGTDLDALRSASDDHGVEVFGTLSAGAGSNIDDRDAPAMVRPDDRERAVEDVRRSIEAAADLGCSTLIVTVGPDQPDLDEATQHNAIVRVLREVAPDAEDAGVTVVPEPLNVRVDHPGYYLTSSDEGYEIVEAVDSPAVKLLFDVYHQQITEGDVIRRFRRHAEHVGLVHVADNPGRHEPGTGELDYERIFEAIADAGYDGYVSCEFEPTGDPDEAFRDVVATANRARDV